jgi:hypothetical protein
MKAMPLMRLEELKGEISEYWLYRNGCGRGQN